MNKFADSGDLRYVFQTFLQPVLDRLDIVIDLALDRFDSCRIVRRERSRGALDRGASRGVERRDLSDLRSSASARNHDTSTLTRARIEPNSLNCEANGVTFAA